MPGSIRRLLLVLALAGGAAPAAAQPAPSPREVLGHRPGQSGWLADWAQIVHYFGRLDGASPRVRVEPIGRTVLGRPMIMAVITSEANQRRLEQIRAGQARLADPRGVPEAELQRLIAIQPAVVFIGASLHGNEIMATQMSMELAHQLATDPELARALEEVVVLLVPGMNPDGLDITRDWWLRTRGTPHAGSPMPWLYHHYVGHENNRDFYMVTQPETEAVTRVLYREWFPEVVYDVHQTTSTNARFIIPPFADPLNPNLDPLLVREINLIGVQMALDLAEAGKTGVAHQRRYDLWWHGGGRTVPARHNMVGILSEAASADFGDPITLRPEELDVVEFGSMFPEPWPGGRWTPRDIVEYELIAATSLVHLLHRQRHDFVRNYVALARRQVRKGEAGDPFAYLFPSDQRDPGSATELLRVLRRGGVEVHEARAPFLADGREFPAETRMVLMAQPYRAHAKDLLEPQRYPDRRQYPGGPPAPPYDLAGWTLPMQMGVEAVEVREPFPVVRLVELDSVPLRPGTVVGAGPAFALDPRLNNTHRAIHQALRAGGGGRVTLSAEPLRVGGEVWPAGTPVVSGLPGLRQQAERWAREWGVDARALDLVPAGRTLDRLRVGLYKPWVASMDEGWTRWVFEQWGVPFETIRDSEIRRGDLRARFDAIVVPDISYSQMMQGLSTDWSPPEYAGGLGDHGADALEAFVRGGGTLVLLDSSSEFAVRELAVPVREVNRWRGGSDEEKVAPDQWFAPGSLLRVKWDASHPLAAGMPDESAVFYTRSPVFQVEAGAPGVRVVARYPERGILMSGYAQGEEQIAGRAALVEARVGEGRVVLFGFRPQHRAQAHETFKVLFNALYLR